MEKSLFEQVGGTYTQVGDYLLPNLTFPEEEQKSIGIWGQRHARYLKQYHKVRYYNLLTSGKLNSYLSDIDKQAEDMFSRLVNEMAKKQGVPIAFAAWGRKNCPAICEEMRMLCDFSFDTPQEFGKFLFG